jgi:uncharacterized protein YukJ
MPVPKYGVLAGRVAERKLASGSSNHYEIHVQAAGEDFRIAVNVQSVDGSEVLYHVDDVFDHPVTAALAALAEGHHIVPMTPDGVAIDYVRAGFVAKADMAPLPVEADGDDNDLNDKIDSLVQRAMSSAGARIFAYGSFFKDPPNKKDKYFDFAPSQGIHDVHMNQGNDPAHKGDDGVWSDGALVFHYPARQQWAAVFLAFQSQSWITDAHGHATTVTPEPHPTPQPVPHPTPQPVPPPSSPAAVRIIAALANSIEDPEIETITLINTAPQDVDLAGWVFADKQQNRFALTGKVAAGSSLRVTIAKPMELSNKGGTITLLDPAGKVVDNVSYTKQQAQKPGWSIVF